MFFTLDTALALPFAAADMSTMVAPAEEDMSITVVPATGRLAATRAVYGPTGVLFSMWTQGQKGTKTYIQHTSAQVVSYVKHKAGA